MKKIYLNFGLSIVLAGLFIIDLNSQVLTYPIVDTNVTEYYSNNSIINEEPVKKTGSFTLQ